MKNYNMTKGVFAALLLVSTVVGAEDKYPASDFQPKVVYQDEDTAKQAESGAPAKPTSAASSASDSQYPAASFEPKVLYADESYKHTESTPGSAASTQALGTDSGGTASVSASGVQKEESSAGYLLGIIVLAIAGYVLFKKGAIKVGGGPKSKPTASSPKTGGLTGVARYMLKTSGTGVSRYLEKNAKNAPSSATGVAKYLASRQAGSGTTKVATGVEKYMRNKG